MEKTMKPALAALIVTVALLLPACTEEPVRQTTSPTAPSQPTAPPPGEAVTHPPREQTDLTQPPPSGGDAVPSGVTDGQTR
jgi:hypothetical protein